MIDSIQEFVNQLKVNPRLITYDEAQTKQALILPLLQFLGWNPFDVEEIMPEFPVETKKIDFCLRINNISEFFIEVKKAGEDLERHEKQLLDYSFRAGVSLAALTNGLTWWFYLPTQKGEWHERKFYAIDILQQDSSDIVSKFIDFLSKENVKNGKALSNAEKLYKSRRKKELLKKAIPDAWNKIICEPDSFLVELLTETTEKLCGLRPDELAVHNFLQENRKRFSLNLHQVKEVLPPRMGREGASQRPANIKPRQLGRKGFEQVEHYIIPVIRLLKNGMEHTEVFHEIANKLDVTYQTVSAQCTRQLKLTTVQFLEYVENGRILNILETRYPEKRGILRKELGSFYHKYS